VSSTDSRLTKTKSVTSQIVSPENTGLEKTTVQELEVVHAMAAVRTVTCAEVNLYRRLDLW
jgi:hypothetical protein